MPSYTEFASWLFPGDPILEANPGKLPKEAQEVLKQVSCATGVTMDWITRSARSVLNGVSGLRCLWFLHGTRGTLKETSTTEPGWVWELINAESRLLWSQGKRGSNSVVDWGAGTITQTSDDGKVRSFRLGKWIRKHGAEPWQIKEFETRQISEWGWEVSCHPFDVLTMSYDRPWTSCMRPGGAAELGPLTDMAAGSAILFFYRPGAGKPCGRTIIRPATTNDYTPHLVFTDDVYGDGPSSVLTCTDLISAISKEIQHDFDSLCTRGRQGLALSRKIYDDNTRKYCVQDDAQYEEAYSRLAKTAWPAAVDVGLDDLRDAALFALSMYGVEDFKGRSRAEVAREVAESWVQLDGPYIQSIESTLRSLGEGSIPTSEDYDYVRGELGLASSDDDYDSYSNTSWLPAMMRDRLEEMLEERIDAVPATVLILLEPFDDEDAQDVTEALDLFVDNSVIHAAGLIEAAPPEVAKLVTNEDAWRFITIPKDALGEDGDYAYEAIIHTAKRLGILEQEITLPPGVFNWRNR